MLPVERILILSVPFVLATKSLRSVVPMKLVPGVVAELPVKFHAVEVIADEMSNVEEATPFTVEVRFVPLNDNPFELMILTPAPVIPFTVVVNVLVEEVL